MEVVQGEAEGAFVDGAATARGVRAGLGALARGGDRSQGVVMKPAAGPERGSGTHLPDPERDEARSGFPDPEAIEKASPEEGPVSARKQP
jgi:hypothetical protein